MSRIGLKPIAVPGGVAITVDQSYMVTVSGPKGELSAGFAKELSIAQDSGQILVTRPNDERRNRSMHGLTRTLISNMVTGVTTGFRKSLDITGVGYRCAMDGKVLVLNVGYSHQVKLTPPAGITYEVEGNTKIHVVGIDKQSVGEEAARIRRVRPPEPYKGKGIRYAGEVVRRKAGKTGKAK